MTIGVVSMIRDAWGGSEELWYEMGKHALKQGHRLIRLGYETPEKHFKIKELEGSGMIHYTRPGFIPSSASGLKRKSYLLWNFLRKRANSPIKKLFGHKPDVVIYNGTCYSIAAETELLKYVERNPQVHFFIIGQLNNEFGRPINDSEARRIKFAYGLSKKVFFVSQRNLDTAQRHLAAEIPNAEIVLNPVNLSSLEQLVFPGNETVQMACVGNLVTTHKGQDVLFGALSIWKNKNWILNIYGSGPDRSYLEKLADLFHLRDKIIFHGKVNEIRSIWEKNQILLMPSIMEGMPLAVVEAMLCGRVCVATDVGGISEWINDGVNGFIIKAPTVGSILEALGKTWSLKDKWPEIGHRARTSALEKYDRDPGSSLLNKIIE